MVDVALFWALRTTIGICLLIFLKHICDVTVSLCWLFRLTIRILTCPSQPLKDQEWAEDILEAYQGAGQLPQTQSTTGEQCTHPRRHPPTTERWTDTKANHLTDTWPGRQWVPLPHRPCLRALPLLAPIIGSITSTSISTILELESLEQLVDTRLEPWDATPITRPSKKIRVLTHLAATLCFIT